MNYLDQFVIDQLTRDIQDLQKTITDLQDSLKEMEEWQLVVEDKLTDLRTDVNRQDLTYDSDFD
jgi:predicted  nucleic acid-binding Zn-ribbon protein